ncbi:MAG: AraC family transcriptional regulator [Bacteroidetes bacterium]|nr:MAG: AraC family transcriptional regulator [Bacteroidota bacterium]
MILDESDDVYEELWKTMMSLAMQGVELNALSLKEIANRVLENFIAKMNREIVAENHFVLSDTDRKHIQRAEQLLNDALMSDFPGIETIARKIGISPTKLKNDFRSMHNTTLYQYFSARQMRAAHELLLKRTHTIKELASLFGYENASKFSAKFQKEMNSLPSQVSKDEPNFSLA